MFIDEQQIVAKIVKALRDAGYIVATEVANLYRSADIAVLDNNGEVWIIECKVSDIQRALKQLKIHKISANKIFIGTIYRNTKESTLNRIKDSGAGLFYVMPDGSLLKAFDSSLKSAPWKLANETLKQRIIEAS